MAQDKNALVWIDMEMSGLVPERDRIIEVAMVVTDSALNTIAEAPVYVIHQSDEVLDGMDAWNKSTHGKSGLIEKVRASTLTDSDAEQALLAFLKQHVPPQTSPLCGNTVHQDRRFMFRYMPLLEAYLHYRILDVSTLKELARRWRPELLAGFRKAQAHTALADIQESIDELAYYREHFLRAPPQDTAARIAPPM
jgi:oligoribonuclease